MNRLHTNFDKMIDFIEKIECDNSPDKETVAQGPDANSCDRNVSRAVVQFMQHGGLGICRVDCMFPTKYTETNNPSRSSWIKACGRLLGNYLRLCATGL